MLFFILLSTQLFFNIHCVRYKENTLEDSINSIIVYMAIEDKLVAVSYYN